MSSSSWVFVDSSGEELSSQKLPASAENDFDLDAPLSDLVEKQRRMSRSSILSASSIQALKETDGTSPSQQSSKSPKQTSKSSQQGSKSSSPDPALNYANGRVPAPPQSPDAKDGPKGIIFFVLAVGALSVVFFMT